MKKSLTLAALVSLLACDPPVVPGAEPDAGPTEELPVFDAGQTPAPDAGPREEDAGPPATPDAGPVVEDPCPNDDGSPRTAVVVFANEGTDSVARLFQVNGQGLVFNTGLELPLGHIPQSFDFNSNGTELLIGVGTTTDTHRVLVVDVEVGGPQPDGSDIAPSMTLAQDIVLDGAATPRALAYTADDRALLLRIGSGDDDALVFRKSAGTWSAGTPTLVPGEFPLFIQALPDDNAWIFTSRDIFNQDDPTHVWRAVDDGTSVSLSEVLTLPQKPSFIYAHPVRPRAYFPENDGTNGFLHSIALDPVSDLGVFETTRIGSRWGISADTALQASNVEEVVDVNGQLLPATTRWAVSEVTLDEDGAPIGVRDDVMSVPASFVDDVVITAQGHALFTFDTRFDNEEIEDALLVFTRKADEQWQQVCDLIEMPGSTRLLVAPIP